MREIQRLLGEAKSKMNGYVALLMLRYGNLCVKADAISLLSVTVQMNDQESNIEGVAEVGILQDDVLAVVPKSPAYLQHIVKGVMLAHPEFKMDIVQPEESKDEDDRYLTFTMPEVDKARHDILNEGVDALNKQCTAKIDTIFEQYTAKIAEKMIGANPEAIDKVKDMLKEVYDFYNDICKKQTDGKKKEIEDAYQKYVAEKEAKLQEKQEEAAAHSEEVAQRLKMDDLGDDEY